MTIQTHPSAFLFLRLNPIIPMGRRITMQWIALTFILLLGFSNAKADGFWDDSFFDMPNDVKQAKAEHKTGVFLFFQMADCPFCHRMETTVFTDPAVIEYMKKHFITASIDIEGDVMMTDFEGKQITQKEFAFKQFRVRATPVMAFIDTQGKVATLFTGPTRSPAEFLSLAEFVTSGAYKEPGMNFFKYRQQHAK
ncbi:MAG: thioredoxin fold domain-containing protein [Halothiobacillaceae bacterium]|nr:thioredoxin fold domain-containing protein [Halothiobacillaceae bacterium]HUN00480.1 thioredoxin fold domain-containing protein [Halothiobacillus sp.]